MSVKTRLQQRKTWFTLAQAAQRLSDEFNEDVTTENVVELALEGDLAISIQVYGAQKVMPLQKGEQLGVRSAPSLSPITGYKPGVPGLPEDVTGHVGAGIYRIGIDAPSAKHHLHRLVGGEPLGTAGTPAWYLIMDDADGGEPHLFVPLQPIKETKLLPFPSPQSLLVRREDLETFITDQGHAETNTDEKPSSLLTIGVLLKIMKEGTRQNHTQSSLIETIIDNQELKGVRGLSKRNLEDIFSAANKSLSEAMKME